MPLSITVEPVPIAESGDGVIRIAGTRIPLERVIRAFQAGATPEQIALDYDVLSLGDVYSVVNWYLQHRQEADNYVARATAESQQIQADIESLTGTADVRARLLARQSAQGN